MVVDGESGEYGAGVVVMSAPYFRSRNLNPARKRGTFYHFYWL